MLWAHTRGTTSASEIGLLGNLFGGADFLERLLPTALENWGDRKPAGRSACAGVVCAMRERKGRAGTEDIRQGIEKMSRVAPPCCYRGLWGVPADRDGTTKLVLSLGRLSEKSA